MGDENATLSSLAYHIWAKSDPVHPLICHMIDAGNVSLALLEGAFHDTVRRFAAVTGCHLRDTSGWLAFLVASHDIGKCSSEFSAKGPSEVVEYLRDAGLDCVVTFPRFRHEAVSAFWMRSYLKNQWEWDRKSAATAAGAIGAHHGHLNAEAPEESERQRAAWDPLRYEMVGYVHRVFAPVAWEASFTNHSAAGVLLAGLVVLSDWIASNQELFGLLWNKESLLDYTEHSRERARQAVSRLGMDRQVSWGVMPFREVWPALQSPRALQLTCEQLDLGTEGPSLYILEAAMGEGKTEAALYVASQLIAHQQASGIYVALPTAATSNQMFSRVQAFASGGKSHVALVHGASWVVDPYTPSSEPQLHDEADDEAGMLALDWFRPKKRSLLASYAVGTVDQAEMAVLHVKHGFLRLYGLAHKVLIIDEIHAYDAYQREILTRLLAWCRILSVPVILLSATLPARTKLQCIRAYTGQRVEASTISADAPYPLITQANSEGKITQQAVNDSAHTMRIRIVCHQGLLSDLEATAERVVRQVVESRGCHLVVCNTVSDAQVVYRHMMAKIQGQNLTMEMILFHARFPMERRLSLEKRVLSLFGKPSDEVDPVRPSCAVVVATQVVEQSLDLDFDFMYSQLAPIDLLLQRVGRLHRHHRAQRPVGSDPTLHIFTPDLPEETYGSTGHVYHPYILAQTLSVLRSTESWAVPEDVRSLIESVYADNVDRADGSLYDDWFHREEREREAAGMYCIPEPQSKAFTLVRTSTEPYDENEGEVWSSLSVRTRLGDDSVRVVMLNETQYRDAMKRVRAPNLDTLRALYLLSVSIPRWWIQGVKASAGFEAIDFAPQWLPGTRVLRLIDGLWSGLDAKGRVWLIRNDPVFGVMRETEKKEVDEGADL